eukprot:CAMPEP_0181474796 /NCGR_PEP_ID=MMETSP1110-20121109/40848_1 /TAXON_ID=174948 /ORGANISM="Symbiodinium sp., Strain CCMP421" /LENGTH=61 /DNA_ID=CAMNT_0023600003 /DNA_START=633 /DNA_END=818 /DNA_ORIENTATION=+
MVTCEAALCIDRLVSFLLLGTRTFSRAGAGTLGAGATLGLGHLAPSRARSEELLGSCMSAS